MANKTLSAALRLLDEKILFPIRFDYLEDILSPYLAGYGRVLDLGAGCGRLGKRLQDRTGAEFIGVDKFMQQKPAIPIIRYDGRHLPFEDDSFDCVMMIDVLHHDKEHSKLISEASRVSRKGILIKDHYWTNRLDFMVLSIGDCIGNLPYGVESAYNFLSLEQWYKLFADHDLRLKDQRKFRFAAADPTKQVIFKLEK